MKVFVCKNSTNKHRHPSRLGTQLAVWSLQEVLQSTKLIIIIFTKTEQFRN